MNSGSGSSASLPALRKAAAVIANATTTDRAKLNDYERKTKN